jgi:hypothetical protein
LVCVRRELAFDYVRVYGSVRVRPSVLGFGVASGVHWRKEEMKQGTRQIKIEVASVNGT